MLTLKYFWDVPSHAYAQIFLRCTQTCLHSNTHKSMLLFFKSHFQRRPGTVAAILAVCRRSGNRRLHYAGLRFVYRQEHLFPQCFGTFSITSFPFHFVLSENNLKIISAQLPENGDCSYFAAEIKASLWTAREVGAKITQSAIQKPTLCLMTRLTPTPPKI